MPSTTRSSSSAIRFPSSKQAIVSNGASSSKSSSKPDAITLLFRREVQSLLSTPPALPSHLPADTPVEVVACVERLSLSGIQQSVQLCQAGDETWVTRTEGARHYFPRAGRVQKRLRGNDNDGDAEEEEEEREEQGRNEDVDQDMEGAARVTVRRKKSKKSRQSHETPVRSPVSSSTSSTRHQQVGVAAPHKKKTKRHSSHHHKSRRERDQGEEEGGEGDFDDGASTETEHSHLARTRGGLHSPGMLTSIGEEGEGTGGGVASETRLGRGQRRCFGRNNTPSNGPRSSSAEAAFKVKSEEPDDLASLCGRVGGLEFRSTVDPDSELERTPAPTASTSDSKGKARAC